MTQFKKKKKKDKIQIGRLLSQNRLGEEKKTGGKSLRRRLSSALPLESPSRAWRSGGGEQRPSGRTDGGNSATGSTRRAHRTSKESQKIISNGGGEISQIRPQNLTGEGAVCVRLPFPLCRPL